MPTVPMQNTHSLRFVQRILRLTAMRREKSVCCPRARCEVLRLEPARIWSGETGDRLGPIAGHGISSRYLRLSTYAINAFISSGGRSTGGMPPAFILAVGCLNNSASWSGENFVFLSAGAAAVVEGSLKYSPEPLDPPSDGNALICCSMPLADIQLDL